MIKNIYLETYGCSANQNNSELIAGILVRNGFNIVDNEQIADLIILNTCVVKDPTIKKIEERIKIIVKQNKPLIIAGCMPEVFEKKLKKIAPKSPLVSTHHVKDILIAVRKLSESKATYFLGNQQEIKVGISKISKNKTISIVQICQGCINECSYCLVKKVKGALFSYPEDKILKEIEGSLQAGAKEIWLTSQDNACYNYDTVSPSLSVSKLGSQRCAISSEALNQQTEDFTHNQTHTDVSGRNNADFESRSYSKNFETLKENKTHNSEHLTETQKKSKTSDNRISLLPQLVNKISSLNHKFFLRIGMMNPSSVLPILSNLVDAYKSDKVFKFLHLPLQSGSDKILKLMNRKYKIEDALKIIGRFKKEFPEGVIATDIIVGFPGETNEDFQETLNIIEKIRPDVLNHSRFWAMKGTEAAKMKNEISKQELKEREVELMKLHAKIALENKQKLIAKEYKVIVDDKGFKDTWLARNENYQLIIIRSQENLLGKFLKVKIKEAKAHYLIGEVI